GKGEREGRGREGERGREEKGAERSRKNGGRETGAREGARATGGTAPVLEADSTDGRATRACADEVLKTHGPIDILIAN
ncbi:short-chain dehydrogenase, partial [Rhizobium ruizarguesonis]